MAINYTFKIEKDLLLVKTSGFDESPEEVVRYGLAVIKACAEGNFSAVLCDEVDLEYRIGTVDLFESAKQLALHAPHLGKAAVVCHERFSEDARFWETVVVNRGLTARTFTDIEQARQWLQEP